MTSSSPWNCRCAPNVNAAPPSPTPKPASAPSFSKPRACASHRCSRLRVKKEAAILRAEGLAEARTTMAKAEAQAIAGIALSLPPGEAATYLLGLKYMEALPALTQGKGTTIFLPTEAAGAMGAIGALRKVMDAAGQNNAVTETFKPTGALGLPPGGGSTR